MPFLSYWFWPNPGHVSYGNPKVITLLIICGVLIIGSFAVRAWRYRQTNPMTKTLTKSWATAMIWFGVTGLIMVVSRVETIQFLAMRALWAVWILTLAAYVAFQVINFRRRHYVIVEKQKVVDMRERYMPGRKRK